MSNALAGAVAVIAGGARGIGRACALRLAEQGANAVQYLTTPLSAYVTSQVLAVDGGATMR